MPREVQPLDARIRKPDAEAISVTLQQVVLGDPVDLRGQLLVLVVFERVERSSPQVKDVGADRIELIEPAVGHEVIVHVVVDLALELESGDCRAVLERHKGAAGGIRRHVANGLDRILKLALRQPLAVLNDVEQCFRHTNLERRG